jgi:hypothetical protein
VAAALEISACAAMCSISSVLFTVDPRVETISLDSIQKKVSKPKTRRQFKPKR